jgi:hypothetical protein
MKTEKSRELFFGAATESAIQQTTWIHAVYILGRDSARWLQSSSFFRVISGWRGQSGQVGAACRTGLMWQIVPGWRGKSFPVGKC